MCTKYYDVHQEIFCELSNMCINTVQICLSLILIKITSFAGHDTRFLTRLWWRGRTSCRDMTRAQWRDQYCTLQYSTAGTVYYITVQYSKPYTIQYNAPGTVQYNTIYPVHYNITQYIRYCKIQHSKPCTVQHNILHHIPYSTIQHYTRYRILHCNIVCYNVFSLARLRDENLIWKM